MYRLLDMQKRANEVPFPDDIEEDPTDSILDDPIDEDASDSDPEDDVSPDPYINMTMREFIDNVHSDQHVRAILDIPGGFKAKANPWAE